MELEPRKYIRNPDPHTAIELTDDNLEEAAKWCGGTVFNQQGQDAGGSGRHLQIPTMLGIITASPGDILAKSQTTGRFYVYVGKRFYEDFAQVERRDAHTSWMPR